MLRRESPTAQLSAGAIVLGYVISAILWITLSDRVLGVLVGDPATLVTLSILKGWGFVALTGAVLAFLLRRLEVGRARQTSELEARENRFRLLAEHAQDVIVRYRVLPTPAFEYVSPSVERLLGYTGRLRAEWSMVREYPLAPELLCVSRRHGRTTRQADADPAGPGIGEMPAAAFVTREMPSRACGWQGFSSNMR